MATTAISNETPTSVPSVSVCGAMAGDQKFPQTLTLLLFPPSEQPLPGPEPPPKNGAAPADAEEAAKTPNVTSQKLDSPRPSKKNAQNGALSANDLAMALTLPVGSLAISPVSNPAVSADETVSVSGVSKPVLSRSPADKSATVPFNALEKPGGPPITPAPSPATATPTPERGSSVQSTASQIPTDSAVEITGVKASQPSETSSVPFSTMSLTDIQSAFTKPADQATTPQLQVTVTDGQGISNVGPSINPVVQAGAQSPKAAVASVQGASPIKSPIKVTGAAIPVAKADGLQNSEGRSQSFGQQSGFGQPQNQALTTALPTAKAEAVSAGQSIDRKNLIAQVANRFETIAAANPKGGVVVQLAPNALGTITVTLKTVGKQIDTQISASNSDVRAALQQSRPELTQAIQSRGYSVSSMTISSEADSSGNRNSSSNQPQQAVSPRLRTPDSTHPIPIFPLTTRPKASSGVDLWI